ncbi:phosphate transporter [Parastagonospora nodorum]|uniref:Phosphate transporter n=1 Tax=Phaeosphaeria nodorum (strain SN15 / ATCC MYA-4574 / FGSC 10173) TaxID=321614 RepID=A0A7U2FBJ1_PHANO|nr:phosphate transporter [Parastagonospora nodorum]QRD02264.1 phosphate transporter [Parastagonospora nodorum SN15]KAH3935337.1 phosphate transporter [Parastagonospora nodorum]KAH3948543.1 phosphate transporter [Parastagonospora nodorum]KAH3970032.1 phosphate transporter [Parastagonospora nodorum]
MAPVLQKYSWILALTTIAFIFSSASNGANDVANSYATSVAARTLKMWQAGILACFTEFLGAVALGSKVTSTIKSGVFGPDKFAPAPATFMLVMGCAEVGSATFLTIATFYGMPVSTTQTVVGALAGAGIAAQTPLKWAWSSGSLSQIAASWAIAPLIAAGISAALFLTVKYAVLERKDPLKWGLRLIPWYLAFTAGMLALFILDELPNAPSFEEMGAGKVSGIILGVSVGVLAISYIFFVPYFHRRLIKNDARMRVWHIPLGPLLYRENPPVYWPGKGDMVVTDYYAKSSVDTTDNDMEKADLKKAQDNSTIINPKDTAGSEHGSSSAVEANSNDGLHARNPQSALAAHVIVAKPEPEERWLHPVKHLPFYSPKKIGNWAKYLFLQGVARDVVTQKNLGAVHARAIVYDNKTEHLWTYAQVASAMMMSIAHGSNDVANAVGPWVASYNTYESGEVTSKADTPIWILVIAGLLLGIGFWIYGFNVMRSLGNKITQVSPTRGFAMELGAAITVLLASRLGLPVSTTQCLTGATIGVALCNFDIRAVNWKQIAFIFSSWIITLPSAGLIAGLLMVMALNTPHF